MRILLVEKDNPFSNSRRQLLEKNGYGVDLLTDGSAAADYAQAGDYGLLVVSERLAGHQAAKLLRKDGVTAPVLLLAAEDTPACRAAGLEDGADDCVGPEPDSREFLARVMALTRRESRVPRDSTVSYGDLTLRRERLCLCRGGRSVCLGSKEFLLMECLMEAQGRVCSRQRLYERAWGLLSDIEYNGVGVYVSFLRRKLAELGSGVSICSVRGMGYRLEAPEKDG